MIGFVAVAQTIPDGHRFPSSAMAMGDSLPYSNGHEDSPGAGMRPTDDRSLASEDLSPSFTLLTQDLFARDVNGAAGTPRVVLVHTPEAPFNATPSPFNYSSGWSYECQSFYRNIVFLPNSTRFFSIFEQSCIRSNDRLQNNLQTNGSAWTSELRITFRVMSVRQADLLPVRQGLKPIADETVLSYLWPVDCTDGERVSWPIVYQEDKNMSFMATIYGMDIAKNGTHLVLVADRYDGRSMPPRPPVLTSLSTINGSRSSIMPLRGDVTSVDGIAFNHNKTKLFAIENFIIYPADLLSRSGISRVRLVSADVDESGYSVKSDGGDRVGDPFHIVHRHDSHVYLSPHSVTSSGRCIYLISKLAMEVFGVDPLTSKLTRVLDVGIETSPFGFSFFDFPADALRGMAATSDGCNLFITTGIGYPALTGLIWVKMRSRCGKVRSAELVARYDSHGTTEIGSLALQELEGRLFLYVGSTDGRLFELEINRRRLKMIMLGLYARSRDNDNDGWEQGDDEEQTDQSGGVVGCGARRMRLAPR
ncbi:hypothetical protein CBR_g48336 [Chara braunii]|uniref:Uncharacterized protein n=1 Tax=Chara braunii TaxID=69332 RepID=A0A388K480_CHABU|nr:hypothetical protein CBR_g48336 [Chara braunii]|eukprot:GBG64868.1 hypothetical protein CBR_g48336 [Chara braunii]